MGTTSIEWCIYTIPHKTKKKKILEDIIPYISTQVGTVGTKTNRKGKKCLWNDSLCKMFLRNLKFKNKKLWGWIFSTNTVADVRKFRPNKQKKDANLKISGKTRQVYRRILAALTNRAWEQQNLFRDFKIQQFLSEMLVEKSYDSLLKSVMNK